MNKQLFRSLMLLVLSLATVPCMAALPRHALVIGNAAYQNQTPLVNTLHDAQDIAAKLQGLGFDVTRVENAGRRAMSRAITEYIRKVRGSGGVALIYYSGHGLQVNGQNYLLPVDARISDELDVPSEGLPVNRMLASLGNRGDNAVNLVILDACRNNPYKTSEAKAIGDKGLARVSAPGGTLILYATKPGDTASDNTGGRNGLFTKHLLSAMEKPGVEVEDAFKQAAEKVYLASNKRQDPWMEGRIRGQFYFIPPQVDSPNIQPIPQGGTQVLPAPRQSQGQIYWQYSEKCGTESCLQAYLDAYPKGIFTGLAKAKLKEFSKPELLSLSAKPAPTDREKPRPRQDYEPEMVVIPSGSFMMGSNNGGDNEKPVHRVSIQSFKMGKYEVTQAQWQAIMGSNPSHFTGCGSNCPVETVSWDDVQEYIRKLNSRTGKSFRLPTEAEWAYACRRGGKRQEYCGGDSTNSVSWYDKNSGMLTHSVGWKQANGFGLYDMSGNVREWTCSAYSESYDGSEKRCSSGAEKYALRGGSWNDTSYMLRSAFRFGNTSDFRFYFIGFRLAQDL